MNMEKRCPQCDMVEPTEAAEGLCPKCLMQLAIRPDSKTVDKRAPSASDEQPGTVIGSYRLLERIGEGGMAAVYIAEQEGLLHRRVALKITKLGMGSKQVVAPF